MVDWIAAAAATILFVALFLSLGIIQNSLSVFKVLSATTGILFNHKVDDREKEKVFQENSLKLFQLLLLIIGASIISFVVPVGFVYLLDTFTYLNYENIVEITLSWPYLLTTLLLSVIAFVVFRRLRKQINEENLENSYSKNEEKLHYIAFSSWSVQKALSGLEDIIFSARIKHIKVDRPVFVTALPRAGTTLLLELCTNADDFVSHTYRDMPFIMVPMLWDKFSKNFQIEQGKVERAHGDGMMVSVDSAEAFEEIIWNYFWFERYHKHSISPWADESKPGFEEFMKQHVKKIISLRSRGQTSARYISKNNLNISRIPYIKNIFPDSIILVPFREPVQHALSLLRQHMNFLGIHSQDGFAKMYMEAIGHFEFGDNLKPVNFDRWLRDTDFIDTEALNFWLAYWLASYKNLLNSNSDNIALLNYEKLCQNPEQGLEFIANTLFINNTTSFIAQSSRILPPHKHSYNKAEIDPKLLEEAQTLFSQLETAAVF